MGLGFMLCTPPFDPTSTEKLTIQAKHYQVYAHPCDTNVK